MLDATTSSIGLYDAAHEEIMLTVARGMRFPPGTRVKVGQGLAGQVALTRQAVIVDDYHSWEHHLPQREDEPITAALGVPLLYGGEFIGVLMVTETAARQFTDADVRLLTLFAEQAASAVHTARLHEQTLQRLEHLTALHAIDRVISSSLDLRVTLDALLEQVITQLRVDAADVLLLNPDTLTLDFAAGRGFRAKGIMQTRQRLGEGHAGHAATERRVVHIPNLPAAGAAFRRAALLADEEFITYVGAPLIVKGQVKGVLEVFHRAAFTPDSEWLGFLEALATQATIALDNAELFQGLQRSNTELARAYDATIEGWSRALDLRDQETEGHAQRVTELTMKLARATGMPAEELVHLRRGALLHDIGKMGIPDAILLKPGGLTDDEWKVMRQHPQLGFDMLSPIAYLRPALDIPCGLKGEEIPFAARLFAVVDVWDALTSDRPYRAAWSAQQARAYIREQAGKHFDPTVVQVFMSTLSGLGRGERA